MQTRCLVLSFWSLLGCRQKKSRTQTFCQIVNAYWKRSLILPRKMNQSIISASAPTKLLQLDQNRIGCYPAQSFLENSSNAKRTKSKPLLVFNPSVCVLFKADFLFLFGNQKYPTLVGNCIFLKEMCYCLLLKIVVKKKSHFHFCRVHSKSSMNVRPHIIDSLFRVRPHTFCAFWEIQGKTLKR